MAKDTQFFVLPDRRRLCFAEYGDPRGAPILYFHGWPGSRLQAALIDPGAIAQRRRIIAPDRPGIGGSSLLQGRRMLDFPNDIARLLDYLGLPSVDVVGVSAGCPHALAFTWAIPDRVQQVLLCSSAPYWEDIADGSQLMAVYRVALCLRRASPSAARTVIAMAGALTGMIPVEIIIRFLCLFLPRPDREALHADGILHSVSRSVGAGLGFKGRASYLDASLLVEPWGFDPADLNHEVTLWHGEEDRNIHPSLAGQLASRLPCSSLRMVGGEGHYSLPIRRREEIIAFFRPSPGAGQA